MIIIDSLIIGGIRFCFDKIITAVDQELHDDSALRQELMAQQMRLELGEITEAEFRPMEEELLARIREIRERQINEAEAPESEEGDEEVEYKITGAEVTFEGDEF